MDNFNYNRFNRNIESGNFCAAISFLLKGIELGRITFPEFWQSTQRTKTTAEAFLEHYFKCKQSSAEIISFFYEYNKPELIEAIKLHQAFDKANELEIIKSAFGAEDSFIKEVDFWKLAFDKSREQLSYVDKSFLGKLNFEQLLLYCGFYYDKIRLLKSIKRNADINLIQVVSAILNYKLEKTRKKDVEFISAYTDIEFVQEGFRILMQLAQKGDQFIDQVFSAFESHLQLCDLYDKYRFQDFTVKFSQQNVVNIIPANKGKYLKYRNDGAKYPYWQNYHQNNLLATAPEILEEIESSKMSWYNKLGNVNTHANYLQYIDAGYPEEINLPNNSVMRAFECFRVLNSIGVWTNIRWNDIIEKLILSKDQTAPYMAISGVCMENQLIGNSILSTCNRVYDEWIRVTAEILGFDEKVSRACFKLLTNNLNDKRHPLNLLETPFIKYGKNVYWIAGIFSNKNYCVTLQNILQRREDIRQYVARNAEQQLYDLFQRSEFITLLNHKYYDNNGEIDLLALKDNHLFIGQIKSTYNRTTLQEIDEHRNRSGRGLSKAIEQLDRDINYLRLYWGRISKELDTSVSFSDLTVVPLAITTSLEDGEGKLQIAGYDSFIVSLFDLKLILRNEKMLLWNITEMALDYEFEGNVPDRYIEAAAGLGHNKAISEEIGRILERFIEKSGEKIKRSLLREHSSPCSAHELVEAITEGQLWDFLLVGDAFTEQTLKIGMTLIQFKE